MTSGYSSVFGGGPIESSQVSYLALNPTGDVALQWPLETAPTPNLLATLVDVNSGVLAVTLTLPTAVEGSSGAQFMFNNLGAANVTVVDFDGGAVVTIVPGTAWVIYLFDNTTAAGGWRPLQLGALVSQAQAASLAGSGLVAIGNTLNGDMPTFTINTNTVLVNGNRAQVFRWTGGSGTFTLPASASVAVGWYVGLRNDGSGALTVTPSGGNTIDGGATLTVQPGDSCWIVCMAAGVMDTVGLGQSAVVGFDYTTINVAGTGDYVLSGSELNRIAYKFTGLLTGDRVIVVPDTVQQYWVRNGTTGAFAFHVRSNSQTPPGVAVAQNQALILYDDGANVVNADTSAGGISIPVLVNQGGTGATTPSGARTNLGSTTVGDAVFIAANAAAALSALGAPGLGTANIFTAIAQSIANAALGDFLVLQSTDAGAAVGPDVVLDRFSASPAVSDLLGRLIFRGRSSTTVARTYADVLAKIITATNAAEDGELHLQTIAAGALADKLVVGKGGVYTPGAAGTDKGVDTINATTLYEAGVALAAKYLAIALLTTNGDIITRVAGAPARLGIGSNGQVLTVSAGALAYATPTSGGLAAASQAQMEAASSNLVAATPGVAQFHPGVAKFFASLDGSSGAALATYNATTARTTTGTYIVTIGTNFSSANWCPSISFEITGSTISYLITAKSNGAITIETRQTGGGGLIDVDTLNVSGFGDQ